MTAEVHTDAVVSPDGLYRYRLERRWAPGTPVVWVMLNPSTADAVADDPTIRRVMGFSRAWGHPAALVVNLFALRATHPAELKTHPDPVGPGNDAAIDAAAAEGARLIAAWGPNGALRNRGLIVAARLRADGHELWTLGLTKHGYPCHPLYLAKASSQQRWPA